MVHLFSDFYEKNYRVSCCSCVALVWFVCLLGTIIAPFFIAYYSGSFWVKEQLYWEHPRADFSGTILLAVLDDEGNSGIYSTNQAINEIHSGSWKWGHPSVSAQRKDDAQESGKLRTMRLDVTIPGIDPAKVRNVQVLATFDYILAQTLKLQMMGLLHVDLDTPNGTYLSRVDGNLNFDQAAPILIDSIPRTLYNSDPLNAESYQNQGLLSILQEYENRNDKLRFDYKYLLQPIGGGSNKSRIIIDVNIPIAQEIKYKPGVLETLKFAWSQYFALFVPLFLVFYTFFGFLFRNQILETSVASDLVPKRNL